MLCNSGVPLVPDCLYQVSGMAYLFGPCMSIFTAMPRPGYRLRMILPVKTQCRRHRRVMEVILLKQKQIKCPYCHAHASLRPASLVYGSTPQTRGKFLYVCDRWPACNAYVSAHERTLLPMGTLANGDLRHKRILAHRALKKTAAGLPYGKMGGLYLATSQTGARCTPDPHRPVFRIYVRASHFPLSAGSGVHIRACCLNGGEA